MYCGSTTKFEGAPTEPPHITRRQRQKNHTRANVNNARVNRQNEGLKDLTWYPKIVKENWKIVQKCTQSRKYVNKSEVDVKLQT